LILTYSKPTYQGSNLNELRAAARKHYTYFKYGTSSPSGTIFAKFEEGAKNLYNWVADQFNKGADVANQKAEEAKKKAKQEL
jgi:hypothetical protein